MRIGLFVDTNYPHLSGVTVSVYTLKHALEKLGHEVYIITINLDNNTFVYDEKQRVLKLPGIKLGLPGVKLVVSSFKRATKLIDTWHLDVIHSHSEISLGFLAKRLAKKYGIPLVHTYHTMYEDFTYYITGGLFKKTGKKVARKLSCWYCSHDIHALIVPSNKMKDKFISEYGYTKEINVIPTGLDLDKFYDENLKPEVQLKLNQQFKINPADFYLFFMGRVAKEKNLIFVMEALPKLIAFQTNIKLIIGGSGNHVSGLKAMAKKKGITNHVIFTDRYPNELAGYYYNLGDLFVMPSISETQGVTVIEALASSKPVLCANDPSFLFIVKQGYNGYLYKDEAHFINLVKELYLDRKKLKSLSVNALKSAKKYSSENYAKAVSTLYKQELNKLNGE